MRVYQVPQHAFLWLVVGALMAVTPHLLEGPVWLAPLVLLLGGWRVLVQRGRASMPGRTVRAGVLLVAVCATLYSFGTILGPQAGVTLLVCAFMLKLLEMYRLRDAYVAIVLTYFVLATGLLLHRNLAMALYVLVALCVVTAALIGINQAEAGLRARQQLRYAGVLVLQAAPLMVALFILVPRVPPLWELPVNKQQARTGISDSMSPGDVSHLSLSRELAFRVEFEGPLPPPRERYWRGLTYSWFDGRTWRQSPPPGLPDPNEYWFGLSARPDWLRALQANRSGPAYRYRVIQEPTGRPWLFTLSVPFSRSPGVGMARDYRLVSSDDLQLTFVYDVESFTRMARGVDLAFAEFHLNTQLPRQGNPRAVALARQWREELRSDRDFIDRVMGLYRREPFHYTLEPPRLGDDPVDEFLFDSRRGFCEHFASSMAVMLRAAGIPARIVAGYQGGELNQVGEHLLVHQYDAHVWVEAWLAETGWERFDPTAMVAPERIQKGLREALEATGEGGDRVFGGLADLPLLSRLRHLADYMEFSWTKWVLGYDSEAQLAVWQRWLKGTDPLRIALALVGAVVALVLPLLAWTLWRNRGPGLRWWQREYWRLYRLLRRRGVEVSPALGARGLVRCASERLPGSASALQRWLAIFERAAYRATDRDRHELRAVLVRARKHVARSLRRSRTFAVERGQ